MDIMNKPKELFIFGFRRLKAWIRYMMSQKHDPINVIPNEEGPAMKYLVGIGINDYRGKSNDLRGCVNDCNDWAKELSTHHNFSDPTILLDNQATIRNVKRAWTDTINKAKSGDVIVFTFSGHGTSVEDISGDENDKRDEAICLYDGLLVDDTIRKIFSNKKEGVKLIFISDSCHSGTVSRSFISTLSDTDYYSKPRYLPPEEDIEAAYVSATPLPKKSIFSPEENDMNHILISGCLPTEYSYDAYFSRRFNGAMSFNALNIIKSNPDLTYEQFYAELRNKLPTSRYPQTPQLEGHEDLKKQKIFS
jgi:hypothetical protein